MIGVLLEQGLEPWMTFEIQPYEKLPKIFLPLGVQAWQGQALFQVRANLGALLPATKDIGLQNH